MNRFGVGTSLAILAMALALPQRSSASADLFDVPLFASAPDDHIFASSFELYTLTINTSIDSWCRVTVDTDPPVEPPIVKVFTEGSIVALYGVGVSPNHWGYWTGTDAGGTDVNQQAQVTMSADRYVFACCPFSATCTN